MEKDYDAWNSKKKIIDASNGKIHFQEREIWWTIIGINIGSEQYSLSENFSRPILIFKKWSPDIFWGIPLTTKIRDLDSRYRFSLNNIENDALVTQLRAFDSRRLVRKVGTMPRIFFNELKTNIITAVSKNETPL